MFNCETNWKNNCVGLPRHPDHTLTMIVPPFSKLWLFSAGSVHIPTDPTSPLPRNSSGVLEKRKGGRDGAKRAPQNPSRFCDNLSSSRTLRQIVCRIFGPQTIDRFVKSSVPSTAPTGRPNWGRWSTNSQTGVTPASSSYPSGKRHPLRKSNSWPDGDSRMETT